MKGKLYAVWPYFFVLFFRGAVWGRGMRGCGLGGGSGSWMVVLIVLVGIHVSVPSWTVRRHV